MQDLPRKQGWGCGLEREDNQSYSYQESGNSELRGLSFVLTWHGGIMWFYSMTHSCLYSICVTQRSWICIRPSVFQEGIFCSVTWIGEHRLAAFLFCFFLVIITGAQTAEFLGANRLCYHRKANAASGKILALADSFEIQREWVSLTESHKPLVCFPWTMFTCGKTQPCIS